MDQTEDKKEIEDLKIRLKKIEDFLLSLSNARNYIQPENDLDPLLDQAIVLIKNQDEISASYLQRKLAIGYSRAARILDQLEEQGYLSPEEGAKPRKVLKKQTKKGKTGRRK